MVDEMVFMGGNGQGLHDTQSMQAPQAFDHLDQPEPEPKAAAHNSINRSASSATPIVERQANRLIVSNIGVRSDGQAIKIVDKQKGRRFVMLQVPTGAAAPVVIGHNASDLEASAPNGWTLVAGANPLTIPAEASIWAVTGTAGTASNVQVIVGNLVPDELSN